MADLSGVILSGNPPTPTNGVTVKVWGPAQVTGGTLPAQGAAEPGSSAITTATTASTTGGDGSFKITGLAAGVYYLSWTIAGTVYWAEQQASALPAGTGLLGTADDAATIQGLLDAANTAGGGQVVLPAGNFTIGATLTHYAKVALVGAGANITTLTLKNAVNVDMLKTKDFATLTGTNPTSAQYAGPDSFVIQGITFDGNKANQTTTSYGLRIYGLNYVLRDVIVRNCHDTGIYSEWSSASGALVADQMEAKWQNVKTHDNGLHGIDFNGPHDTQMSEITTFSNGVGNSGKQLWLRAKSTGTQVSVYHHYETPTGQPGLIIEDSRITIENFQAEGNTTGPQIFLNASECVVRNGRCFPGGTVTSGGGCTGIQIGGSGSIYGTTGATVGGCWIEYEVDDTVDGAVDFANSGGFNIVNILGYTPETSPALYKTAPQWNDECVIRMNGVTPDGTATKSSFAHHTALVEIDSPLWPVPTITAGAPTINWENANGSFTVVPVTCATTAVTGVIVEAGAYHGQRLKIQNQGTVNLTAAAAATSHVAMGTSWVLQPGFEKQLGWDANQSLWYSA